MICHHMQSNCLLGKLELFMRSWRASSWPLVEDLPSEWVFGNCPTILPETPYSLVCLINANWVLLYAHLTSLIAS